MPRALRWGSGRAADPAEHRGTQLMQARKWQLHLRLDAHGLGNAEARSLANAMAQERRLAHPGLTANDEHLALARADVLEQPAQRFALADPAPKTPADCGRPYRLRRLPTGSVNRWGRPGVPTRVYHGRDTALEAPTLTPPTTFSMEATHEQH